MKKTILIGCFSLLSVSMLGQVQTPPTSTKSEIHQAVGLTDISIDYSRPNIRGRLVFGDLVPYGRIWRTGANMNSVVTFGSDVEIDGKVLKKGSYAIYTIPKVEEWEVIFYKDTNNWGVPQNWDDAKVALSTKVKVQNTDRKLETFTIGINNVNIDYADLDIAWERSLVSVRFKVPTDTLTMKSIEETFNGPKTSDYYGAAEYFYLTGKDITKALSWINKAIEKTGETTPYYYYRLKSQIQAKMGNKTEAVATAKISLDLAEKANNLDYIKMNKDAIREWSK